MRSPTWMWSLLRGLLAATLVALSAGVAAEGPASGKQVWLASGSVSDDAARDLGLRIIERGAAGTLFEADVDAAYRLLDRGHFIARAPSARPGTVAGAARPGFGEALTRDLLAGRPLSAARERLIAALADSVSADSIRETVRFLSYDAALGAYRSRFAPRSDLRRDITPYVSAKLADCLGPGGVAEQQEFKPLLPAQYRGDDSVFVNVVARLPGGRTAAHYILCAHYDAIAARDPLWQAAPGAWKTVAAPGADDNATGVAALLEAARLLSGLDLDVGVTFIAFSGEELGLLGSYFYADGLSDADSVIGVINLDMLGYAQDARQIALTYDLQSTWLADLMADAALSAGLSSPVEAYDATSTARGDHAAFWGAGIPAVMLADAQDGKGNPRYPHYHTTADTLAQVDIEQVRDNVRLVVAYLGRFAEVQAEPTPDFVLTPGSIEWQWAGRLIRPLIAGDSVTAVVRAVNQGGSMLEPGPYSLQVNRSDGLLWRPVAGTVDTVQVAAGGIAEIPIGWTTDPETYGELPYQFVLLPLTPAAEEDRSNNIAEVTLSVMPPSTLVRNLHAFPNPVTSPGEANLRFEILHPESDFTGRLAIWVYDLEGDLAGKTTLVRNYLGIKDIAIGVNTVLLAAVIPAASDLAPGLYICVAELEVTGQRDVVTARSKFAVAR